MSDPMQQSLQGQSQFVSFDNSSQMQQSLCGVSEKILIPNASSVNRQEIERDKKAFQKIRQDQKIAQQIEAQDMQQSTNQFLNVGKWNKPKSQLKINDNNQKDTKQQIIQQEQQQQPNQSKVSIKKNKSKVSKWNKNSSVSQNDSNIHIHKSKKPLTVPHEPHWHQHGQHHQNKDSHHESESKVKIHKSNKPLTVPYEPHWHQHGQHHQQTRKKQKQQEQQDDQDDDQDEDQEESEQQSQQQSESEEQSESQEDQESEEDEDEQEGQQVEEQPEQQQQQQQQLEQDKFREGIKYQIDNESSQALQTQIANTSVLGSTPKPSKWAKKKPLQTMTKYEIKQCEQKQEKQRYHSRLNSTNFENQPRQQITENYEEGDQPNNEQWSKIQKVLMRLKMLLI